MERKGFCRRISQGNKTVCLYNGYYGRGMIRYIGVLENETELIDVLKREFGSLDDVDPDVRERYGRNFIDGTPGYKELIKLDAYEVVVMSVAEFDSVSRYAVFGEDCNVIIYGTEEELRSRDVIKFYTTKNGNTTYMHSPGNLEIKNAAKLVARALELGGLV